MHRHTYQTAAVKAITVIQTRLWETVGACVGPPAPPSGSARSDKCSDTADISYMCSKLKLISSFICVRSIITSVFSTDSRGRQVSGVSLVPSYHQLTRKQQHGAHTLVEHTCHHESVS